MSKISSIPDSSLRGLKGNFKSDVVAGFLVFLIALPLCLSISKASGFPPIAGVYTAIVGGILVSFMSNAQLTIKGPAAGLIVIALGAVNELGQGDIVKGYQLTLAVGVIAGATQFVFGLLRFGSFSDFFPASVIHGMLAAIGITIAAKQIHVIVGVEPISKDTIGLILEIPESLSLHGDKMNPEVALIGVVSLAILFIMPLLKNRITKAIPAPMVVLLVAVPMGMFFDLQHSHDYDIGTLHFHIDPGQLLVVLPHSFLAGITLPDFSQILSLTSIKYVIMFALVGSIESLLSTKAVDALDPHKRKANMNKDLMAVGIGNIGASFIGGLPMISEIVRSSANINNGAQTKWANFFHGLFLLLAILLIAPLIQEIPNAALGAMLIYTGYRLAAPSEFIHTYKIGPGQLILFLITLLVTLFTDLLIGVGVGIIAKMVMSLTRGVKLNNFFSPDIDFSHNKAKGQYEVKLKGSALFSNFIPFKRFFDPIDRSSNVSVDFSQTKYIDHTYLENLHLLEDEFINAGGRFTVQGFDRHHFYSDHALAARIQFNNPFSEGSQDIQLNKRQKRLKMFADEMKYEYEPRLTSSILKMSLSPFSIGRKAKFGENLLVGNDGGSHFFFADIQLEEYRDMTKQTEKMTVLYMSNLNFTLPDFTLEKETFLDLLTELQGYKDIDFEDHPTFSGRYFLVGEDENAVRKLFKKEVIEFFEKQKIFHVECRNSSILVYKQPAKAWSVVEMRLSLVFLQDMIEALRTSVKGEKEEVVS